MFVIRGFWKRVDAIGGMMARVLNKRRDGQPPGAVYVGRPSKWGNPFVIGRDGLREEVIRRYEQWLHESGMIAHVHELRGRDLVCWCVPEPWRGDVLMRLAAGR